ncbi:hypothetical protein LYNGBM3L_27430 [Moorena producens 3L]|uniref:Uncharacterized protein n=1 Tax=Moorena producens 3L TaxID=489825 RepID=F4XT12_9CYAN|nr:hypothetical protein LYNGBM3L_27430 [Moorena producens 3L]
MGDLGGFSKTKRLRIHTSIQQRKLSSINSRLDLDHPSLIYSRD